MSPNLQCHDKKLGERCKTFQRLVFALVHLRFGKWSNLPFSLPSLIVQWPARIFTFSNCTTVKQAYSKGPFHNTRKFNEQLGLAVHTHLAQSTVKHWPRLLDGVSRDFIKKYETRRFLNSFHRNLKSVQWCLLADWLVRKNVGLEGEIIMMVSVCMNE